MPIDVLTHQAKIDDRWLDGVWIGVDIETDEVMVGTANGVFKARSIRRKPEEDRWDKSQIKGMTGLPWKPYNHTSDDTIISRLPREIESQAQEPRELKPPIDVDLGPRRFRIERRDLEKMGYTSGCPGCYASRHKRPHRTHTEHCRSRLHKIMMEDSEYRGRMGEVENRENRWLERQVELADQRRKSNRSPIKKFVRFTWIKMKAWISST